jgi:hypothetical protein
VKQGIAARIILAIVFAGLVFSPLIIKRFAAGHDESRTKLDLETALARHGFYLQEVSHAAGVNFVHQAPTLDPRLNHIMPQVASMGASVSIVDFDHDGWPDIYVTSRARRTRSIETCTTARLRMSRKRWASPM